MRAAIGSLAQDQLQPDAAPRLGDLHRLRRIAEIGIAGQVQMLAVGAIEHVVDAGRELQLVAETIAGIQRKRGEARAASKICLLYTSA